MKISKRIEEINCLFCYCPLYKEKNCPGTYTMMNDNIKDCTDCTWVHKKENYKRSICNWQNSSNIELANQLLSHPNIRIISSMIKRRLFEDVGGFKEEYFGGEDMTFWFEVALCGNIGYIDEILFHRRIHDNNTVKKFKGPRLISYLKALDYLKSTYDCVDKSIYRQRYYSKCLTGLIKFIENDG